MSKYQENERNRMIELVKSNSIFYGGKYGILIKRNGGEKLHKEILLDEQNNIYKPILSDVLKYFKDNKISWWGGYKPTGHTLSSQIACLNHLFSIKNDKNAVLAVVQSICADFTDVLELDNDTDSTKAFISFEVVSKNDYLNECKDKQTPTRGANCTSIDALILAKNKDGKKFLLPIEWKYTEFYNSTDKSTEDGKDHEKGSQASGKERLRRYSELIKNSEQLSLKRENYISSVYFFEPFYQLMRQTLWTEQMIANPVSEKIQADDFIHIHVIPKQNHDLLKDDLDKNRRRKGYTNGAQIGCLEEIWKSCLINKNKYKVISPEELLQNIDKQKYSDLLTYLQTRYWQ